MRVDNALIESLLFEEEGVELDFKLEQYRFINATDAEKSELLKDILAFANAWRRTDAFILIGVQEVKGGRSTVAGILELLEDASLQQFVNWKTQRPVVFSYRNVTFEGKSIAIIHIPVQERPIYLKKDFGKLSKETVYVRRGSSTDIASPDEISRMGLQLRPQRDQLELKVFFADPKTRTPISDTPSLRSLFLDTPELSSIPDYSRESNSPFDSGLFSVNYNYYRELVKYTKYSKLLSPLYLAVSNDGSSTANDVRLEIKVNKLNGNIVVMDAYQYPREPQSVHSRLGIMTPRIASVDIYHDIEVKDIADYWLVEANIEKVQPKGVHWFESPFYLGAKQNGEITLEITIFCDNLPQPGKQSLIAEIQSECREIDLDGIEELEWERYKSSPEYQRMFGEQKEEE